MKNPKSITKWLVWLFIYPFIFIPIIIGLVSIMYSNQEMSAGLTFTNGPTINSLKMNLSIITDSRFINSLILTISCAIASSLLAVGCSFVLGFILSRYFNLVSRLYFFMVVLIYSIPPFTVAIGLSGDLGSNNRFLTILVIIFAQFIFIYPFCQWFLLRYYKSVPYSFDRQAAIDNASNKFLLFSVIYPYLKPVLLILFMISFTISFNDIVFSIFISNSEDTKLISHFIIDEIYPQDQNISRYGELSFIGFMLSCVVSLFYYFSLNRYFNYLKSN